MKKKKKKKKQKKKKKKQTNKRNNKNNNNNNKTKQKKQQKKNKTKKKKKQQQKTTKCAVVHECASTLCIMSFVCFIHGSVERKKRVKNQFLNKHNAKANHYCTVIFGKILF